VLLIFTREEYARRICVVQRVRTDVSAQVGASTYSLQTLQAIVFAHSIYPTCTGGTTARWAKQNFEHRCYGEM